MSISPETDFERSYLQEFGYIRAEISMEIPVLHAEHDGETLIITTDSRKMTDEEAAEKGLVRRSKGD